MSIQLGCTTLDKFRRALENDELKDLVEANRMAAQDLCAREGLAALGDQDGFDWDGQPLAFHRRGIVMA